MGTRTTGSVKALVILLSCLVVAGIGVLCWQIWQYSDLSSKVGALQSRLGESYDSKFADKELELLADIDKALQAKADEYFSSIRTLEEKIRNKESNAKIAYLTFDDGPFNQTDKILDILQENGVRATFFVVGKKNMIDRYKRIASSGHTLANHTFKHNIHSGLYNSVDSFMSQIEELEQFLYQVTGQRTNIVRFPGGSPQAKGLKKEIIARLKKKGYCYVDWNSHVGDGSTKQMGEKEPYDWYEESTKGRSIIVLLMHDYSKKTIRDLPRIVQDLKRRGFIFLPLSNKSIMVK